MDFARSYPSIGILYLHKYNVLLTSSKWNIVRQLKPKNSAEINTIIILNTTGLYWWCFSFQTRIQTETSTRTHQQHHSRIGGMAFRGHTSSSSIHPHGRHPPFHSHSFSTPRSRINTFFCWTTIPTLFFSIHDHLSDQVGIYRYIRNSQRIVLKEKNKNTSPHLSPSSYSYDPPSSISSILFYLVAGQHNYQVIPRPTDPPFLESLLFPSVQTYTRWKPSKR